MATFKYISSKNADYGAAEQYLTFEHDEFTMKPTLDEAGRLILREDYRIATLNCGEEDFAVACMRSNLRYGKNQKREDVKSHHYIISFDPRDATDNGLTVDRAQRLGEKFCAEHFPGHQAIVCTHSDGHNHSGNIHVHIVINSLRIEEVPLLPYMDRPADTRAGCKHRCTDVAMEYFKAEVMEMCHRENLYQIDLLNGSKNRITEREYWAQKKGQLALDKENAAALAAGQPVRQTKFETDKAKLRQTIRNAMNEATTFDEFSALLLQQGVTVKESRGRLSYLTPDRTKPITARKLGDDFDRAAVLALLEQNAHRAAEQRRKHLDTVEDLKRRGFTNPTMQEWTFANDNGKCPQMEIAHFYVEHWEIMREENIGYLLWGKVGTGKSYFAGCIANALMEQEVAVRMTNFSAILNDLTASFEGRNEYIERLCRFPLLIIDDFGMERGTEYGLEQVYNVIDSRYRSRKPLIVTTNLTLDSLQNPLDTAHARIYDRLLEMCAPILFTGENFRRETAQAKLNRLKELMK